MTHRKSRLASAATAVLSSLLLVASPAGATSTPAGTATVAGPASRTGPGVPPFANPPSRLGHCRAVTIPVPLPGGDAGHLAGHLCVPNGPRPHAVQLLLHGGTYNSSYWSYPVDPAYDSYAWRALAAHYAVLAVDRLGYGQSTRPPSTDVTFDAQAATLHRVVRDLRSGPLGRYKAVIGVGHSYGSANLDYLAAQEPGDFTALVLTGAGHKISPAISQHNGTFAPASAVAPSRFGGLDDGYTTNATEEARVAVLYDAADVTPRMAAYDFGTEDTLTSAEQATRPDLNTVTPKIHLPILLLDGATDSHYCDGVAQPGETDLDDCTSPATFYASEQANYQHCMAAGLVPDSGHDLTTERGAPVAAATMLAWTRATVPPGAATAHCAATGPYTAGS